MKISRMVYEFEPQAELTKPKKKKKQLKKLSKFFAKMSTYLNQCNKERKFYERIF